MKPCNFQKDMLRLAAITDLGHSFGYQNDMIDIAKYKITTTRLGTVMLLCLRRLWVMQGH